MQAPDREDTQKSILERFDAFDLNKQMDRVRAEILSGHYSSFYGPLMCTMSFQWDRSIPTACTNGSSIRWNPYWFMALPKETRVTVMMHELGHTARLHGLRCGQRDPLLWNYACDIRINNDLRDLGYKFTDTEPWMSDGHLGMAEEDIYDDLMNQQASAPETGPFELTEAIINALTSANTGGDQGLLDELKDALREILKQPFKGDMEPMSEQDIRDEVNNVVRADQQSKLAGGKGIGELPGNVEYMLEQFLSPMVPWEKVLADFMKALAKHRSSWARPRRRIQHIYLPGKITDRDGLQHLNYYWDVSGSISEADEIRFNSEVRFIKDRFDPPKLSLIEFDTQIQYERTFEKHEKFQDIKIIGKGGTCFECVHEHIERTKPSAAIIFTDLYGSPMRPLVHNIPVIWIVVNNPSGTVPFGKIAHIRS